MQWLRETYSKFPMITVRVVSFVCSPWIAVLVLFPIQEVLGEKAYQHMYVPVLSFLGAVHCLFLGRAAMLHVKADHTLYSRKRTFYHRYNIFLRVFMVLFVMTSLLEMFFL